MNLNEFKEWVVLWDKEVYDLINAANKTGLNMYQILDMDDFTIAIVEAQNERAKGYYEWEGMREFLLTVDRDELMSHLFMVAL